MTALHDTSIVPGALSPLYAGLRVQGFNVS